MQKSLLVLAALVCLTLSACDANIKLNNIESGSITITSDNRNRQLIDQIYEQNFQNNIEGSPSAILAFQGFFSRSSRISQWHADVDQITSTKLTIVFHHQGSEWNSIKLGYWVSSRDEILLGTVSQDIDTNVHDFSRRINFRGQVSKNMAVRTFLNGYQSQTNGLVDLQFMQMLSNDSSTLRFRVKTGDMLLKKIYLSYIIINADNSNFLVYGGSIKEDNLQGSYVYNTQNTIHETPYSIYGLTAAKFTNKVNFRFNAQLQEEFFFRIDSSSNFDKCTILFIVIGLDPQYNCESCSEKFLNDGQCVSVCPANQYEKIYQKGGRGCRSCPDRYGYQTDLNGKNCICKQGYQRKQNGFCVVDPNYTPPPSTPSLTSTVSTISTTSTVSTTSSSSQSNSGINSQFSSSFTSVQGPSSSQFSSGFTTLQDSSFQSLQSQNSGFTTVAPFTPSSFGSINTPSQLDNSGQTSSFSSTNSVSSFSNLQTSQVNQQQQPFANIRQPYNPPTKDCSGKPNTFFNGIDCVCKVGYENANGACIPTKFIGGQDIYVPPQFVHSLSAYHNNDKQKPIKCNNPNQIYDGQLCACKPGYRRNNQGKCQINNIICYANSIQKDGKCVCLPGYKLVNGKCIDPTQCIDNAFYNGVQCVCKNGYYMSQNKCVIGSPCPPNSQRKGNNCVCINGFTKINGICSRCPEGKVFTQGQCVTLCGINEVVDANGQCKCKQGYGKYQQKCSICPQGFFEINGFCVICPIGSIYNSQTHKCTCKAGYVFENGYCYGKCSNSEVFNIHEQKCKCKQGMGRINGQCQICPISSIDPSTQKCLSTCKKNEVLMQNKCVCQPGYGIHNGNCIDCESVSGKFLSNGYCASCPKGYALIDWSCQCPHGYQQVGGKCQQICSSNEAVDQNGYCYQCPLNQILLKGKCECRDGLTRVNGNCQKQCQHHIISGLCAFCPLGTSFNQKLGACVCGEGFYKNTKGYCVQSQIPPIQCHQGTYYSPQDGCLPCPNGCSQCESFDKCTACKQFGMIPSGNVCRPRCGDNILARGEECDDGNTRSNDGCSSKCIKQQLGPICGDGKVEGSQKCDDKNSKIGDGCSSCKVDPNYSCSGQPSICKKNSSTPQNHGLTMRRQPLYNMMNIFILLKTDKPFNFKDDQEMKNFMKFHIEDRSALPTMVSCHQEVNPSDFRCLLVYTSGLPNKQFDVDFSYDYNGEKGFMKIKLDPTKNAFNTRSLV